MQFLYLDWCIDLRFILLGNVMISMTSQKKYSVSTDSNKGELANQNAAYKMIALE